MGGNGTVYSLPDIYKLDTNIPKTAISWEQVKKCDLSRIFEKNLRNRLVSQIFYFYNRPIVV